MWRSIARLVKGSNPQRQLASAYSTTGRVPKSVTADQAITACVKSGDSVFVHTAAATPSKLTQALSDAHGNLKNVLVSHLHTEGSAPYASAEYKDSFRVNNFFVGANVRKAVNEGRADFVPIFLSEIPLLLRSGNYPLDVALLSVSPPDKHGYCSLGVSVDVSLQAFRSAKYVIAQVNPCMPRTHGWGLIHTSNIDYLVDGEEPLHELKPPTLTDTMQSIGKNIAGLIEDGSTLQMGIGGIPDATLSYLDGHKDLGIHTEMFSEGVIGLVEKGVVTNEKKTVAPGQIASSFLIGTKKLYDFVDDNPFVTMFSSDFANDPAIIRKNPKVVAINSAIEVDLTGQVCAQQVGTSIYSGIGGQMDFERGAALSPGGKPVIALPSRTSRGEARIVNMLKPGASVSTTRAHVHYVVTEFGVAYLWGKNVNERAAALIGIAHPDDREQLEREWHSRFRS